MSGGTEKFCFLRKDFGYMQRATWTHWTRHAATLFVAAGFAFAFVGDVAAQQQPRPRTGGGQGGQGGQGGNRPQFQLPDDKRLVEIHEKFVIDAEKLAADYERGGQIDKARVCYTEILRLVPTYTPAADKLAKIKEKEATAEKKLVDIYANKGWQDTGVVVTAGRPIAIRSSGQWTLKMTYNLQADGLEIPKELRDFPLGAMIGLIADSVDDKDAKPFLVGSEKSFDAPRTGKLFLRIYDSDTDDNVGRIGTIIEGSFKK